MRRISSTGEFFDIYNRLVGALSSLIPASMYLALMIASRMDISMYVKGLLIFLPLTLYSYFLDTIYNIFRVSYLDRRHPILIVSLIWLLSFPIIRLGSEVLYISIYDPLNVEEFIYSIPLRLPLMLLFGLIYGFYFWVVYIYMLKVVNYLSRRLGGR